MTKIDTSRIDSWREAALAAGNAMWREAGSRASDARDELTRRTALARQPQPAGAIPPSLRLLLGELSVLGRRRKGVLAQHTARSPQPVMLLPGFGAHPMRMRRMMQALETSGHAVHEWGLGFNLGPTPENFAFLLGRVSQLARQHDEPVTLVGWSLGGLFARELARRQPANVRMVITLGTPFSGDPRANNAWRAYQFVTGHTVDEPPVECDFAAKPPVPTVALWSPKDGIIAPRAAAGWPHERDRAVALRCNHLAFASDPGTIAEVLHQLDWED